MIEHGSPRRPNLRSVLSSAARLAWSHPLRVWVPGVIIFGLTVPEETYVDSLQRQHAAEVVPTIILAVVETAISMVGDVVYPGVLERLIGDVWHRREGRSLGQVLLSIPYWRLLLADLLVSVAVIAGFALFIAPGIIAVTFLCLTGCVINIEDLSVLEGVKRSVRLVRPRAGLVFLAVTIPYTAFDVLDTFVGSVAHELPLAAELVVVTLLSIVLGTILGLVVVVVTFELMAGENELREPPARRRQPTEPGLETEQA